MTIDLKDALGHTFKYYSKPYEALCKENFSFILKYLRTLTFESGLRPLIEEDKTLH